MTMNAHVLIIGAGMSGLACARTLAAHNCTFAVLEASNRVGGRLGSDQIDGQWFDRGFQVSMSNYRTLESLVPRNVTPRHPFISGADIWDGTKRIRVLDPRRKPLSVFQPFLSGLVKLRDIRAANRCRTWAATIASGGSRTGTALDCIIEAGFSPRFLETFLRPFFGGVFLDEQLDVPADRFLNTLHRFATGEAELPTGGMQQLAEGMAAPIREHIHLEHNVQVLTSNTGVECTHGATFEAEHIVLATEFDQTNRLLGGTPPVTSDTWSGTIACHFSTDEPVFTEPLLVLNGSSRGHINLICSPTSVAPGYRTDDRHAVLVSLRPFTGSPPAFDANAIAQEAGQILGVDASRWTWHHNSVIPHALPRPNPLDHVPDQPEGIWVTGDWIGEPSIETAVEAGVATAHRVLAQ